MGSTVTQTRTNFRANLNTSYFYKSDRFTSPDGETGSLTALLPFETTTSFRSGGAREAHSPVIPQSILAENLDRNLRPFDRGHEFRSEKTWHTHSHSDWEVRSPKNNAYFRGALLLQQVTQASGSHLVPALSLPDLDITRGTRALSATRPTKSSANLSQALSELIVDLPVMPLKELVQARSKREMGGAIGSNYLATVFAWAPLVQDVLKLCEAVVKSGDLIDQYIRDSGRQVRRRFDFEQEKTQSTVVSSLQRPLGFPAYDSGVSFSDLYTDSYSESRGITQVEDTITQKYWFSGAWMYHIPGIQSGEWWVTASAQAKKLLGIKLDAELLWELAPWSWLADWLFNIGDLISVNNAIANDSLVLRYGYLMRHTNLVRRFTHSGVRFTTGWTGPITYRIVTDVKERVRATPYGFGIRTENFSPQQWAILAALGLTSADRRVAW